MDLEDAQQVGTLLGGKYMGTRNYYTAVSFMPRFILHVKRRLTVCTHMRNAGKPLQAVRNTSRNGRVLDNI